MGRYRYILLIALLLSMPAPSSRADADDTGQRALAVVERMEAAYGMLDGYTATFLKQELVDGELLPRETIKYKFQKPFKVYMGWHEGPHEGREALFVRGRYDNQVVGHEGGWLGLVTLHMDPDGSLAMSGNRHPITDSGIGRLVEIVGTNVRRAAEEGDLRLTGPHPRDAFGRKADYYVAKLPEGKGYYGAVIELWVDAQYGLPTRIKMFGWDGELLESYGYRDLVLNPAFDELEFDSDYEGYDF